MAAVFTHFIQWKEMSGLQDEAIAKVGLETLSF